jgi:hypothetical protein
MAMSTRITGSDVSVGRCPNNPAMSDLLVVVVTARFDGDDLKVVRSAPCARAGVHSRRSHHAHGAVMCGSNRT